MRPLLACFLLLLTAAVASAEHRAEVRDKNTEPRLSPEVREHALARLRDIRDRFGIDVVVVFQGDLPAAERVKIRTHRAVVTARKLAQRTLEQAQTEEIDGVLVVYYHDPDHVVVVVHPEERQALLPPNQAELVRKKFAGPRGQFSKLLAAYLGGKKEDKEGDKKARAELEKAVQAGIDELQAVLENRNYRRETLTGRQVLVLVGGFLASWLVLLIGRAWVDRYRPAQRDHIERLPAQLGAMFGTPAGFWVYDRLFVTAPTEEAGPAPAPLVAPEPPEPTPPPGDGMDSSFPRG